MSESRISAGATEKLPGWDKPRASTSAWSYDMEGHARKCVERYCELANKKDGATVNSSSSLFGRSPNKKRRIGQERLIVKSLLPYCIQMLVPGTKWST